MYVQFVLLYHILAALQNRKRVCFWPGAQSDYGSCQMFCLFPLVLHACLPFPGLVLETNLLAAGPGLVLVWSDQTPGLQTFSFLTNRIRIVIDNIYVSNEAIHLNNFKICTIKKSITRGQN